MIALVAILVLGAAALFWVATSLVGRLVAWLVVDVALRRSLSADSR